MGGWGGPGSKHRVEITLLEDVLKHWNCETKGNSTIWPGVTLKYKWLYMHLNLIKKKKKNSRCNYVEGILAISTTDRAVSIRLCTLKSMSLTSSLLYILYIFYLYWDSICKNNQDMTSPEFNVVTHTLIVLRKLIPNLST